MISVTRASSEPAPKGLRGMAWAGDEGVEAARPASAEGDCDASRRMTRTSSSTERPFWAARSRSRSRTASSSFRIVRLAITRPENDGNASSMTQALQSHLPDDDQNADKGDRDDPQRHGPPAVFAGF